MPPVVLNDLRRKGRRVLAAMDANVMADKFMYHGREFWVTRNVGITPCICQACQRKGRIV